MLSFSWPRLAAFPLGRFVVDRLCTYHMDQVDEHPVFGDDVAIVRCREISPSAPYLGKPEDHLSLGNHNLVRVANQNGPPVGKTDFEGLEWSLAYECL